MKFNKEFYKLYILIKKEIFFIIKDTKSLLSAGIITIVLLPGILFVQQVISETQKNSILESTQVIGVNKELLDSPISKYIQENSQIKYVFSLQENVITSFENDNPVVGHASLNLDNNELLFVFNSNSNTSSQVLADFQGLVGEYVVQSQKQILENNNISEAEFNVVNFNTTSLQNLKGDGEQSQLILFLVAYFIVLSLMQGSLQFAIEITTGEKERNTLSTTLSLNVSRTSIVLSKVFSTLIMSFYILILNLLSILISFKLFPDSFTSENGNQDFNLNIEIFFKLFIILFSLALFNSALMSVIGIFSRNQKEAGIYATPILLLSILIGISSTTIDSSVSSIIYIIPILGHVAGIREILINTISLPEILLVTFSTLVFTLVLLKLTIFLFKKEEFLFRV